MHLWMVIVALASDFDENNNPRLPNTETREEV